MINPITELSQINEISFSKLNNTSKIEQKENVFDSFYQAAINTINETNKDLLESEQLYVDLATGKTDDILSVTLAQQKADLTLNFTVQMTTKIIEAYREIMRMQL